MRQRVLLQWVRIRTVTAPQAQQQHQSQSLKFLNLLVVMFNFLLCQTAKDIISVKRLYQI